MLILFILLSPFIIAQILVLWFESEFVIEYAELLRLDKIFKVFNTFKIQAKAGSSLNFKEFLILNYVTTPGKPVRKLYAFLVKLITCSICLSTWFALLVAIIASLFYQWILGPIVWFPIAYLSLFLYEKIKKMIQ